MKTLREHALESWAQEQDKRKQSERKKRKRKAKKIEADIHDLLPRDSNDYQFERELEDSDFGVVVVVTDGDDTLRFTYDGENDLALIGECLACHKQTVSKPIDSAADLGEMLESFETGPSHDCSLRRK
ncbi:MAG TPA: hypothetical protein VKC34_13520 [Blastocatellia bacterium]|nr:hypothetical protein [Blastocatellia bacterium]